MLAALNLLSWARSIFFPDFNKLMHALQSASPLFIHSVISLCSPLSNCVRIPWLFLFLLVFQLNNLNAHIFNWNRTMQTTSQFTVRASYFNIKMSFCISWYLLFNKWLYWDLHSIRVSYIFNVHCLFWKMDGLLIIRIFYWIWNFVVSACYNEYFFLHFPAFIVSFGNWQPRI